MDKFEKILAGNDKFQFYFLICIFVGVITLSFFIFKPFLMPFLLAIIFAIAFKGFHRKIVRLCDRRPSLAAFVTVLLSVLLVLVPLALISVKVFSETSQVYMKIGSNGFAWLGSLQESIQSFLNKIFTSLNLNGGSGVFAVDLNQYFEAGTGWLLSNLSSFFSSFSSIIFKLVIFVIMLYYLFRHGSAWKALAINLSPLPNSKDLKIIERLESAVNSIIKGSITIAIIQGILAGFGLAIFGVPQPALWGTMAAIAALVPSFGTSLVLGPAIIYLGLFGEMSNALGLLVWGALAVGLIDNFLAPKLISRGANIHPFLIFLSVLGGLVFFGPVGFLLGPLTISLLMALLEIYFFDAQPV